MATARSFEGPVATLAMDVKEVYAKTKEESKKQGVDFDKMLDQVGIANPMGDIDAMVAGLDRGHGSGLGCVGRRRHGSHRSRVHRLRFSTPQRSPPARG